MFPFPTFDQIKTLILAAKLEDLDGGDVTSRLMIPPERIGVGTLVQKSVGVVCGLPIVEMICGVYDERLRIEQIPGFHFEIIEGRYSDQHTMPLVRIRGPMTSLLAAERIILNFLQHLSGVATLTQRYVRRIEGMNAKIYDTRKTLPGFRLLEKYAVRCGGGMNHRIGLFDAVLVKDNHLAVGGAKNLSSGLSDLVQRSRREDSKRIIEVEVDTLSQLREVLRIDGINIVLLDNMDCPQMTEAVMMRDAAGKRGSVELEASGGVTLETVRSIALSGVERISVGAITHSAPALDIGLDVEEQ